MMYSLCAKEKVIKVKKEEIKGRSKKIVCSLLHFCVLNEIEEFII